MVDIPLTQLVANNNIGLADMAKENIMTDTMVIVRARDFALKLHGNQKYGSRPYGVHLKAVATKLRDWDCRDHIIAAGWLHDTIEDTMEGLPLNAKRAALRSEFGSVIEDIVWACTGVGTTRGEEFRSQMDKLEGFRPACFVKAADRISNMRAVGDDIEFEEDKGRLARLVTIGHNYHTEFDKFMHVVGPMVSVTVNQELRDAHSWCQYQTGEATRKYRE